MVKIFEFEISNASSAPLNGDMKEPWYANERRKIVSTDEMEEIINCFIECATKRIIDIKVNIYEVRYHNNGRGNTNHIVYTIIYE